MSALLPWLARRMRDALGSGPATVSRKLIIVEALGRELALDKHPGEPVYPGTAELPDEMEHWLWISWSLCEMAGWP